ncbi:MAG: LptF/LptG family permease [Bacteroidales bacterium]|nr:LptF/LptG family permease [Bacteroidales bacterium]
MKKLDIFTIKSFIGPLFATFFISLFVLLMQFLWKYIDDLVGKGLEASVIAELLFYASATLIPMALPLAVLLASIMTFGNMGEKFELTAIKAAGISLQRTMRPLIIFSAIISFSAFIIANDVIPYANLKMQALLWSIKQQRPEMNIKSGIFNNDLKDFSIRITSKDPVTNMMYNFRFYNHSHGRGNSQVTIADSGSIKTTDDGRFMVINLYNGVTYEENEDKNKIEEQRKYAHSINQFDEQVVTIDMSDFDFNKSDENLFRHNYQTMNLNQLDHWTDSICLNFYDRTTNLSNNFNTYFYLKNSEHEHSKYVDSLRANRKHAVDQSEYVSVNNLDDNTRNVYVRDTAYLKEDSMIRQQIKLHRDSLGVVYSKSYKDLKIVMDLDSLYESMPPEKQKLVKQKTLEYATEMQNTISRNWEELATKQKSIAKYRNAWHQKFTLSLACLIFFFIGAPLGAIIRKGGFGLPIVVSVLVFIIYYIISTAGMKMARESVWQSWQGMWLSTFIILPLGIFLTYKATVDAQLFNSEVWSEAFSKIGKFFKNFKKLSDTNNSQDEHKFRSYCINLAIIAGVIALAFAFSPLKIATYIFGGISIVLSGITYLINKKLNFKNKFVIVALSITLVAVVIALATTKKKKNKSIQTSELIIENNSNSIVYNL